MGETKATIAVVLGIWNCLSPGLYYSSFVTEFLDFFLFASIYENYSVD